MANEMGQNHDFSATNPQLGLGHDHSMMGQSHHLAVEQYRDHGASDDEQGLRDAHDRGLAFSQTNKHVIALQDIQKFEGGKEEAGGLDQDNDLEADQENIDAVNHDLRLMGNHELVVSENHHLSENSDLEMDRDQHMCIVPVSGMPLEVSPHVLQSRALADSNHQLTVGQVFVDVRSCRRAVRDAAVLLRFEIQTLKSDKTRFTAKCAKEGCSWWIHAAKLPGVPTFSIRTIHEEHNCEGITHLGHQQASVDWVANTVGQRILFAN